MTVPIPDDEVDRLPPTEAGSRRASRFSEQVKSAFQNLKKIARFTLQAEPDDPPTNQAVIWFSDGTGTGDEGDLMIKLTDSNGTTKSDKIVDFSTL